METEVQDPNNVSQSSAALAHPDPPRRKRGRPRIHNIDSQAKLNAALDEERQALGNSLDDSDQPAHKVLSPLPDIDESPTDIGPIPRFKMIVLGSSIKGYGVYVYNLVNRQQNFTRSDGSTYIRDRYARTNHHVVGRIDRMQKEGRVIFYDWFLEQFPDYRNFVCYRQGKKMLFVPTTDEIYLTKNDQIKTKDKRKDNLEALLSRQRTPSSNNLADLIDNFIINNLPEGYSKELYTMRPDVHVLYPDPQYALKMDITNDDAVIAQQVLADPNALDRIQTSRQQAGARLDFNARRLRLFSDQDIELNEQQVRANGLHLNRDSLEHEMLEQESEIEALNKVPPYQMNLLRNMIKLCENFEDRLPTIVAMRSVLILPFIQMLGCDPYDAKKVRQDFLVRLSNEISLRLDFVIFDALKPVVAIQCVDFKGNMQLSNPNLQFLPNFLAEHGLKLVIVTDGNRFDFYSDLHQDGIMDPEPFLHVQMTKLDNADILKLVKLMNATNNLTTLDRTLDSARQVAMARNIKAHLIHQIRNPDQVLIEFFLEKFQRDLNLSDEEINHMRESFGYTLKEVLSLYISDRIFA